MNLLHEPWMPVRDEAGARHWITPEQLSDSRWRAFDADRPDFNGALAQFAIGLLQTTTPIDSPIEWRRCLNSPPAADTLRQWFAPVTEAFVFDGDGARFMQDIDLGSEGVAVNEVAALLIDSPGEQTLKNNADHFVKRGQVGALCPPCASMALLTLQLNAPSGGAGHRTGLRGGGPLTTLVLAPEPASLWQHLWMNVALRSAYLDQGGDKTLDDPQRSFPWLGPISNLQPPGSNGQIAQSQVHPAHLYWAMPRRIRLQAPEQIHGSCGACGRDRQTLYVRYATRNYGLNYKGEWRHPLSPYYETEKGWLCVHPQPGGIGYRHWMPWVLGVAANKQSVRVAGVVQRILSLPPHTVQGALRLWAFGYDMDNMKARCWYEATLPLHHLADLSLDARQALQAEVGRWLDAAEIGADTLRDAVFGARFRVEMFRTRKQKDAVREHLRLSIADFWDSTEATFYRQLQTLIDAARQRIELPPLPTRKAWRRLLAGTALRLFDENFVGAGPVEQQNPRRAALARRQLLRNLHGPKLRAALGLPMDEPASKPGEKPAKRRAKETA